MSYRTGKSYRRRIVRVTISDPTTHRLKGKINQLRREIELVEGVATRFGIDAGIEGKREMLAGLEKQLKGITR